jgi:hypothetical protein
MIDYPGRCAAHQGLAGWSTGDAPDFAVFFPDALDTGDSLQGSQHLLPELSLKRIFRKNSATATPTLQ